MVIHQVFPTPAYVSTLGRELTQEELRTIDKYKKKTYKNSGNRTSNDSYVLENETLKNLKKDLNKNLIDYFKEVVCTSDPITPYITQSWLNYTDTNQYHHKHYHSNSHISGVFYVSADPKVDYIRFYKYNIPELELTIAKYNPFNSMSMGVGVKTGMVILFPSTLPHGVEKKKVSSTSISLSFKTYFKGTIERKRKLTALTIQ